MPVKEMLELLIERVCTGNGSQADVGALPSVLEYYGTHFGDNEDGNAATEQEPDDKFPTGDILVNAAQAAEYLGFTPLTHKRPASAVLRLSAEKKLHAPVRIGDRTQRWKASWIRDYKQGLMEVDANETPAPHS